MLEVGDQAPKFSLHAADSSTVTFPQDTDSWSILYFYPEADTPGCTTEACGFRDRFDGFRGRNVRVYGVSTDDVPALQAFKEAYDLPFTLLSDPDGEIARAYDSWGDGVALRNSFVVRPDGEIGHIDREVTPDGHAETLLKIVDSLREDA